MPPRHTYWTIILEGKPTAFRAHTEEELLPTLKQLQARHPDAVMRWFARGKLWHSQEEERLARAAREAKRENRGRDWRPGGLHRDPRERFQVPRDERRRRFRDRLIRDRREAPGKPPDGPPPPTSDAERERRPPAPRRHPSSGEAKRPWKPAGKRPWKPAGKGPWKPAGKGPWKPAGPGGRPPGRSWGGRDKPGPRGEGARGKRGGRGGGGRGGGSGGGGPR
jgi:23S rRNA pseudouridine2605 synthase